MSNQEAGPCEIKNVNCQSHSMPDHELGYGDGALRWRPTNSVAVYQRRV